MKKLYRSKEVYVLGIAVLLLIAKFFGLEMNGILDDATEAYIKLSPVIALFLRIFFTKDKLTF